VRFSNRGGRRGRGADCAERRHSGCTARRTGRNRPQCPLRRSAVPGYDRRQTRDLARTLRFDVLFKGDDWRGTEKVERLERDFKAVGVEVVYLPYTTSTSSTALRQKLRAIETTARKDSRTADCAQLAAVWENMTKGSSRSINPVWPMGD
jgi:hypothetical protein